MAKMIIQQVKKQLRKEKLLLLKILVGLLIHSLMNKIMVIYQCHCYSFGTLLVVFNHGNRILQR